MSQHGKTEFVETLPKFLSQLSSEVEGTASNKVVSPTPGVFEKILVKEGEQVKANQPVAVIIAMKMEYVLKAPKDGVVKSANSKLGQSVAKGEVIVAFEEQEDEEEKPKN